VSMRCAAMGALLASALLVSCGGGSGAATEGAATEPAPSSSPPPSAYGKVELVQVSRVFTAGADLEQTIWETPADGDFQIGSQAKISVDGEPTALTELSIAAGELVLLAGVAHATEDFPEVVNVAQVQIDHVLDGPIEVIDQQHSQLVVLGVTVEIGPGTYFNLDGEDLQFSSSDIDLTELKAGDRIAVSGNVSLLGRVIASRITRSSRADELVNAYITKVDLAQQQFSIANLTIEYAGAQLQGLENGGPMVGQRVRVRGTLAQTPGVLLASSVVGLQMALPGSAGYRAALSGLVTQATPGSHTPYVVQVEGYSTTVQSVSQPDYCGPPIVNSLAHIEGTLEADGTVSANYLCSYSVSPWPTVGIRGPISAIDPEHGTLTVLGFDVQPTLATQFQSADNLLVAPPVMQVGEIVDVDGDRGAADGTVLAVTLQAFTGAADSVVQVHGFGFQRADPLVYVLGRAIRLTTNTTFGGLLSSWTESDFFANAFPRAFHDCGAAFFFHVDQGADGALSATSISESVDVSVC